jgi:hypothetical protein
MCASPSPIYSPTLYNTRRASSKVYGAVSFSPLVPLPQTSGIPCSFHLALQVS